MTCRTSLGDDAYWGPSLVFSWVENNKVRLEACFISQRRAVESTKMHTAIRLILKQAQGESESVNCWDDAASCIHFILEVNTQHVFIDSQVRFPSDEGTFSFSPASPCTRSSSSPYDTRHNSVLMCTCRIYQTYSQLKTFIAIDVKEKCKSRIIWR